jgi:hypothetical protein
MTGKEFRAQIMKNMLEVSKKEGDHITELLGAMGPGEYLEKLDLAGLSFWGGPDRAFFEEKTAEECFAYLRDYATAHPNGSASMGIYYDAVISRSGTVVKERGANGQIWLIWKYRLSNHPKRLAAAGGDVVVPFGKHRGQPLKDIPFEYLVWLGNFANDEKLEKAALAYIREIRPE